MGAVPGDVDTDRQPPMTVPLRHFLVALGFLLAGALVGTLDALGALPATATLAHVHLLLLGWVCVTILGAMTQFVPVWSGTDLHSRRLATLQLPLVAGGLVGFAGALLAGELAVLPAFGAAMLAGFWAFAYNLGRTLWTVRPWDVTERHFALALAFLVAVTALGLLLALGYAGVAPSLPVSRVGLRTAHATLAVFGVVLTTVFGALYQLAPMFAQSPDSALDRPLRALESVAYPLGVVTLAGGRLVGHEPLARVGGVLVVAGVLAVTVTLARTLLTATVDRTPMLTRYAVGAVGLGLWAVRALPAWLAAPTAPRTLFGAPRLDHLLLLAAVGFVVLGTLYHVVPFIVWVHRYSDRLGLEAVPMIDDLYDDRVAAADLAAVLGGTAALVAGARFGAAALTAAGGAVVTVGFALAAANLALVVRRHGPHSLARVALGPVAGGDTSSGADAD